METHLIVYLYLLVFFLIVEFLILKKVKIVHDAYGVLFLKESINKKRRKIKGLAHLYHGYLLGFALILKIIFFNVNLDNIAYYFLAIFFSVITAFIYMYDLMYLRVVSFIAIFILYYSNLKFICQEMSFQNILSYFLLLSLLILIIYISKRKK